jgi:penicillin-binding protein 1A
MSMSSSSDKPTPPKARRPSAVRSAHRKGRKTGGNKAGKKAAKGAQKPSGGGPLRFINDAARAVTRPRNLVLLFFLAAFSGAGIGMAMVYLPDPSQVRVLEQYTPSMQVILYDDKDEVFGELEAIQRRKLVAYQDIPEQQRNALLAIEDSRFFWHVGVDPISVLGAVRDNITGGFGARGASTITMQLARGLGWSSPEKTPVRKLVEAFYYALQTERYFSKERILELYMNTVFMGHDAYGFGAAAELYFDKELDELTLAESALLAGIVQRPNDYYPLERNQERAFRRRELVLRRMLSEGYITDEQYEQARNEPLDLADNDRSEELGAYFTEEIRRNLYNRYGSSLYESGMRVRTTLDPRIQAAAERALDEGLRRVDKTQGWRGVQRNLLDEGIDPATFDLARWSRPIDEGDYVPAVVLESNNERALVRFANYTGELTPEGAAWTTFGRPENVRLARLLRSGDQITVHVTELRDDGTAAVDLDQEPEIEGAVLVFENRTGEIKAEVGGRRFDESEFNRARQAVRQTGSGFKPFVYAAALQAGHTAGDVTIDMRMAFTDSSGQPYEPHNHNNEYTGITTYTEALARSRNVVAVDVQQRVGSNNVIAMARNLGITANLQPYLSLALGTVDVSLWEMTRAYAVFANGGVRVEPHRIRNVVDREGRPVFVVQRQSQQVMDAEVAYEMVRMLNNVIEYVYDENGVLMGGSGRRARPLVRELGMPLAGKTGTTDNYSDAWFVGFSPYHTIGVWVGNDTKKPIGPGREGANTALPIWIDVMRAASQGLPPLEFEQPLGVVLRTIDAHTGLLSSNVCGPSMVVAFVEGTDPTRVCGPEEARILSMNYYQQAYFIDQIRDKR